MGKNRERHRAKQAKRRQQHAQRIAAAPDTSSARSSSSGPGDERARWVGSLDDLIRTVMHVECHGLGNRERLVGLLAEGAGALGGRDQVARRLLQHAVGSAESLLRHGWDPDSIDRVVIRRTTKKAAGLTRYGVAEAVGNWADPGERDRWAEQLESGDLRGRGLDPLGNTWAADVSALVAGLDVMAHLPALADLRSVRRGERTVRSDVDERLLAKVRGLLAKAESSPFPEEADAFMTKAQEMIARYSLDRAVLEADRDGPAGSGVEARRCWLDDPYLEAKAILVHVVAESNRCQSILSGELGFVTLVGHPDDIDGTEALFTSLLIQATRRMTALASDTESGTRTRRTAYRRSFLVAYANRIGDRLEAANKTVTQEADAESGGRLLPVLARRAEAAEQVVEDLFPSLGHNRVQVSDWSGWAAGTAAADLADLGSDSELATSSWSR